MRQFQSRSGSISPSSANADEQIEHRKIPTINANTDEQIKHGKIPTINANSDEQIEHGKIPTINANSDEQIKTDDSARAWLVDAQLEVAVQF
jgi:hypothetical protein